MCHLRDLWVFLTGYVYETTPTAQTCLPHGKVSDAQHRMWTLGSPEGSIREAQVTWGEVSERHRSPEGRFQRHRSPGGDIRGTGHLRGEIRGRGHLGELSEAQVTWGEMSVTGHLGGNIRDGKYQRGTGHLRVNIREAQVTWGEILERHRSPGRTY